MTKILIAFFLCLNLFSFGQTPEGKKELFTIKSEVYKADRKIAIYLPPNYEDVKDEKLPLIFVFDGQWEQLFNYITSSVSYLSDIGVMRKYIIIGIYTEDRRKEFIPEPVTAELIKKFKAKGEFGYSNLLDKHIKEEVLPFIESKFKVENFRLAIGHSLGGTYIMNSFAQNQNLFNSFIAFSPNLEYDSGQIVKKINSLLLSKKSINSFVNISVGDKDLTEQSFKIGIKQLDSIFKTTKVNGLRSRFDYLKNETHQSSPFKELPSALTEFANLTGKPSDEELLKMLKNNKSTFSKELKIKYKAISEFVGYNYIPTEREVNTMAYFSFNNKNNKEAIKVADWGLELYPKALNIFDSKAEFLDAEKDYTTSLEVLQKGQIKLEEIKSELAEDFYIYYKKMLEDHIIKTKKNGR